VVDDSVLERQTDRGRVVEQLADLIVAVERPHPARVAIDGMTAAGKTSLADELVGLIERRGRPVIRASIDDFHRPAAERYRRGRYSPKGYYLDGFDYSYSAVRAALLLPLGPGGSGRYRPAPFDSSHERQIDEPERQAPSDAILLVDGVFLFRDELNDVWDFRVFVDIDVEDALRRGPLRDRAWMDSLAVAKERYERRYAPGDRIYLETVRPIDRADVMVDNRDVTRPRLWSRGAWV
jgi:uridine kinase